ncbi:phytanoyl-CoA dioxygenase family protein [Agrobacterium vitis]|uniref:phytanoyl-CoA dioxygenase family protein n=1 Tax=Allorhizobium ampelinum TaxID=3025782 RepID=UPI001F285BA3|nr:phytanoyl-CoA dioxygenase family protein [Allorhizobium ampelinum]MCF1450498.1 phytanoyl-CoA dioxygenase family protein [Allorhizobium ampelinum]
MLSSEEIETYKANGFLLLPSILDAADIRRLTAAIDELLEYADRLADKQRIADYEPAEVGQKVPRRIFNPFEQHAAFREIATDQRIIDRVASLIGKNIGLQHSKLNMKAAKIGKAVEWHQDLTYFPHTNDDLVGVLIYLDEANVENGCLRVVPGQHGRYFDHTLPDGSFAGMITEDMSPASVGEPIPMEGGAGTVVMLHPLAPHYSAANISAKPRRLLIFEYRAADAFPIFNGEQVLHVESVTHHLCGEPAKFARFGGPAPAIWRPQGLPRSLFELQASSRKQLSQSAN